MWRGPFPTAIVVRQKFLKSFFLEASNHDIHFQIKWKTVCPSESYWIHPRTLVFSHRAIKPFRAIFKVVKDPFFSCFSIGNKIGFKSRIRPPMCSPRDSIEGKEAPKSFLVPNEVKLVAVPKGTPKKWILGFKGRSLPWLRMHSRSRRMIFLYSWSVFVLWSTPAVTVTNRRTWFLKTENKRLMMFFCGIALNYRNCCKQWLA